MIGGYAMSRALRILCLVAAAGMIAATAYAQRTTTPRGAPPPQAPPTVDRQPFFPDRPVVQFGRFSKFACPALVKLRLTGAEIVSAGEVVGPNFTPPDGSAVEQNLPAFCRVVVRAFPTRASDIKIEVWLPLKNYNLRYEQVGNG